MTPQPQILISKRDGRVEPFDVNKIKARIECLKNHPYPLNNPNVDNLLAEVMKGLRFGMNTSEIDEYVSQTSAFMTTFHPEYEILAARISVSNHQKMTQTSFKDKMRALYTKGLVSKRFYKFVDINQKELESMIDYTRDYLFDYFGFKTMLRQYIFKIDGKPIERPGDVYMRQAVGLCMNYKDFNDNNALQLIHITYDLLSNHYYTHATPTMLNSGTNNQQLSSCLLLGTDDNLEDIMKT